MATILIIEDNENIRVEVSEFFRMNGFETCSPEGFSYVEKIAVSTDAVLLDINLENYNGFDICKKIRKVSNVPILFVTCRDSEEDELHAMNIGGDDYIRKPYSLPVLLAKVKRMVERNKENHTEELWVGEVCLNLVNNELRLKEEILELTKNEMKILYHLFMNKNCVVTKDELIEHLWENKLYVDENILNVNLSRLRKRLSDIGCKDFIETIPKAGYRICSP